MSETLLKDGVDFSGDRAALASALTSTPVDALLGVTSAATTALKKIGITTVFDLAHAQPFTIAARLAAASRDSNDPLSRARRVPDAWVVKGLAGKEPAEVAAAPAEQLAMVNGLLTHAELVDALGVETVSDLAHWPAFSAARSLAAMALGAAGDGPTDSGTPDDLLPANGVYPTEIFYYSRLFLDELLGTSGPRNDLAKAGPLSVGEAAAKATGFQKPALGALVTMEQSWHVLGLALGQLLHAVALAPGESVRIAMIDWSRRTAGTRDETGSESEALTNQTQHNRAISEVATAVATEVQSGGSTAVGNARTEQGGVSGGVGPVGGTYSQGSTTTFGQMWSSSSGSRNIGSESAQSVAERTQQAAAAARSRRATVVQEVEESEASTATTRVVANYNHMHAMTVQYYETVQVFSVRTQVARVQRCIFVPIAVEDFDELPSGRDAALVAGTTDDRELRGWLERLAGGVRFSYPKGPPPPPPGDTDPLDAVWDETIVNAAREVTKVLPGARPRGDEVELPQGALIAEIGAPSLKPGDQFTAELHDGRRVVAAIKGGRARFAKGVPVAMLRQLTVNSSSASPLGSIDIAIQDEQGNRAVLRNRSGVPAASMAIPLLAGQDPLTSAQRDSALARLKSNRLRYNQAIWAGIDPATLALLLSDYDFEGRPVMEQIDPSPIALVGNYLVFRMNTEASDAHLAVTPQVPAKTPGERWHDWLLDHGLDKPHPEAQLVALPSGGVFAEAVLGRSNSAEQLDVTRFWNWQDSPIPLQPTEILPPSTETRAGPIDLKPGEYPAPMVNIVAPTAVPDPTGMSSVLGAVVQGDMFRNMSGMDFAASLARAAMEASTTAASSAGTISAENFAEMNRHKEAIFDRFLQLYGKGAVGGTAPGNRNISTAGAALNYGRQMDGPGDGTNASGGSTTGGSGGGDAGGGATAPNAGGGDTNGPSGGSAEGAAFGSLIGEGGAGGGGGRGGSPGITGTIADMVGKMATMHWGLGWKVVPGLLEAAKKYGLALTKPGAEAIYDALTTAEVTTLADSKATDAMKLSVLTAATKRAIDDPKNAAVKPELEKLVADVKKRMTDGGTP